MQRDRAIFIGINNYLELQALKCAQQDAVRLYDWWTQEANLGGANLEGANLGMAGAILATDSSANYQNQSTYPTLTTLSHWLKAFDSQNTTSNPSDRLWVFFSGYGESAGGQDYVLPVDATPGEETTRTPGRNWLPIEEIYQTLKALPSQQILLILDTNRSQSVRADGGLGHHTQTLAQDYGIATILASKPQQFSHESPALRQGLFTMALIEGLRLYPGESLQTLMDFLTLRLPELSEHHNRPVQTPWAIATPDQLHQIHLPGQATLQLTPPTQLNSKRQTPVPPAPVTQPPGFIPVAGFSPDNAVTQTDAVTPTLSALPSVILSQETPSSDALTLDAIEQPLNVFQPAPTRHPNNSRETTRTAMESQKLLQRIVILSGLLTLVLGLSAILRRSSAMPQSAQQIFPPPTESPTIALPPKETVKETIKEIPVKSMPTQPSPDPSPRLDVPASPPADSAHILEDARAMIRPTSASQLNQAIDRAQQIPPGDPRRPETERQINRWSQDILDLASKRAGQGNYKEAIATANLVPKGPIYEAAQKSIGQWKTKVR
jgi:uncharacterized caspase-like protein